MTDMKPVADQVTRYVAERIVERQRMMEGRGRAGGPGHDARHAWRKRAARSGSAGTTAGRPFLSGLGLVAAGALVGLAVSIACLWDRLAAMGFGF